MQNKRFTNVNFTKRVDHKQGFRPVRAGTEPALCTSCGSVYVNRRWHWGDSRAALKLERPARHVICPACKKVASQIPGGIVGLAGPFLCSHRDQIVQLLKNEATRASEDNPLARIMGWKRHQNEVLVMTTTEHLAQRLGHALEKAFHGELHTVFSNENKFTRFSWHRD